MPSKASRIPFRAHKALLLCSAAWVATAIGMITAQAQVVVPAPDADVVLPNGTLANLRAPDPATTEVTYTGAYTFGVNSGIRLGGVGFGGVAVWSPRAVTLPATGPLQLDTDPATNQPGTFRIGNETAAAALSFGRTWLFLNSPGAQLDLNGHSVAFQWLMTDSGSRIFNNATRQATLTADTAFVSGIGGSLDGNIALVVRGGGGGSFSLLSANTYTGGTLVTGGARVIGGVAGAFGTGDLAIEDGSMVRIQAKRSTMALA